ncbi:c6 zinc finger domain containing protein [Grosmannia clavigera kw1407]|uniref:C6 zinc finger domain containing protein n=1 Tax=Grosmannia clavigera (strain kw1407 / UAMH 11150) TaxID=655863 RepID=F0XB42_GROCL|nr:c6 zinc finger domain containing protein [Grosmannia clavigera kw1407]EFX04956.1 c6 zinc finger domain containing protein [Grosmannia clavigera kw1407]
MSTITYDGWVPPTFDEVDFSTLDCKLAAAWFTSLISLEYNDTQSFDAPIEATYNYITSFVPNIPTLGQALDWYGNMSDDSDIYDTMVSFPIYNCSVEVCKQLNWSGDADLAGIGMMFVYYLAAALATAYFVLLGADRLEPFKKTACLHGLWSHFIAAFDKSTDSFLDAALLFCISIQIAGTYRHTSARIHPDKTHSLYWLTNATYMSLFTIFPPLMLQIASRDLKHKRVRLLFWLVVIAFTVTNIAMYYSLTFSSKRLDKLLDRAAAESDTVWLIDCEPVGLRESLDYVMIVVEALLGINFFVWVYAVLACLKNEKGMGEQEVHVQTMNGKTAVGHIVAISTRQTTFWAGKARLLKLVNGGLCCMAMWALLGLFTRYRGRVEHEMGSVDDDAQWSFGQVLSLATWAPVAIELLMAWAVSQKDITEGKNVQQETKQGADSGLGVMKPYTPITDSVLYLPHRATAAVLQLSAGQEAVRLYGCQLAASTAESAARTNRVRSSSISPSLFLSDTYSEKVPSGIEDRLARIEEALVALSRSQRSVEESMQMTTSVKGSIPQETAPPRQHGSSGSSIESQVAFACHYLQDIIDNNVLDEHKDGLSKALFSLQRLSGDGEAVSGAWLPYAKPLEGNGLQGLRQLAMPPLDEVLGLLRELRRTRPVTFPMVCAFGSVDGLTEHCRRLYLPVREDDVSFEAFLTVNAALFFLFKDKMALAVHTGDQEAVVRFLALRNSCRDNVETALAHMPLVLAPRPQGLLALVLGAGYGIEMSRPGLASRLNTAACQMAVELGYHRDEEAADGQSDGQNDGLKFGRVLGPSTPMQPHDHTHHHILFWLAYMHDRALSLRLGRAPILHDYDITAPRTLAPLAAEFEGHRVNIASWIVLGEVQGRMYRDLYSPAARRSPLRPRVEAARSCADVLLREADSVHQRRVRLEQRLRTWSDSVPDPNQMADMGDVVCVGDDDRTAMEVEAMLLRVDEVTLLSSLTMAFRAIPPGADRDEEDEEDGELDDGDHETWKRPRRPQIESTLFCDSCVAMARRTMQMHLEYLHLTDGNPMLVAMHMHWTILLVPFVPFVVLFCYVMEQPNAEDLCYLQRCMETLQPWQKLSAHAEQLFRICRALYEAAQAYAACRRPGGL